MAAALSEEQFLCSICLESFKNPVSIPCGHNFCLECIKRYWDTKRKSDCPLCKETFKNRPELRVNVGLKDITEQFKRSLKGKPGYKPVPPNRLSRRQSSKSDEVPCDICDEHMVTAVQSCLICKASYCNVHLTPHQQDPVLMKHQLLDPATFATSHLCRNHNKLLEMFCKTDQTPVCLKCTERDHKQHEIIPMEKESKRIKTHLKKTEAEFEQMIQARIRKTEEIKHALERSQINKEREIQTSVQIFTMVISAIETSQALLIEDIEEKQEAVQRKAEELLNKLQQEISELQRRRRELQSLEQSRNHLHLVLSSSCLSAAIPTMDWSEVRVQSDIYIGTVRRAFSKLVDICSELDKKLSTEEVISVAKYAAAQQLRSTHHGDQFQQLEIHP